MSFRYSVPSEPNQLERFRLASGKNSGRKNESGGIELLY